MESPDGSLIKSEILNLQLIIHSLKLSSTYNKYQVQVKCGKDMKKETPKLKKGVNTDVVFFESSLDFQLKVIENKNLILKFKILEFVEGQACKNGKLYVFPLDFFEQGIESKDLYLENCSDASGIICLSLNIQKSSMPSISFSQIQNENSIFIYEENKEAISDTEEKSENSETESGNSEKLEGQIEKNEAESGKNTETISNNEKFQNSPPPTSLMMTAPNVQSKNQSFEQSQKSSDIGSGNNQCNCCIII